MQISKIIHKGEPRLKIDFPFNQEIAQQIKGILGAKWSRSLNAWHIADGKSEFDQLKAFFPDADFPSIVEEEKCAEPSRLTPKPEINPVPAPPKNVSVQVIGRRIVIKLPKNTLDTHFILSLRFSRWDAKQFCWIVPNYPGNLDLINDYFKNRISELIIHDEFEVKTSTGSQKMIKANELLIIKTTNKRLKLIFGFNKQLTHLLKKMPFYAWDAGNKWWTVPYSEKLLSEINTLATAENLEIRYEEEAAKDNKKPRISAFDVINFRTCPEAYILKLKELRYSENTIRSYTGLFEEFINYYHKFDIQSIDEKMIIAFMQYLVIERKVSTSYQNQSINAIKFFYERVLGGQRKIYMVDRPRQEKTLPEVLSEAEIVAMMQSIDNIKHKAVAMTIYSAGLRLSEVVNLRIKDIDSNRMQIFVQQAKGRKDRYTLLSKKLLPVLRDYYREYNPKEWLFEGPNGAKYSVSSVQSIIKAAYARAGIKKKVSTHSLRHSFGTHLLENGTDLRYIQSLMGHESSKTTELYTHITTKGIDQIVTPLDKLNI